MSGRQLSLFEKLKSFKIKGKNKASSQSKKKIQGDKAEALACSYLQKHSLILLEKNFATRAGEVDLIMRDKNDTETLIFVEVRYRKNQDFGGAAASVTSKKQQRIIKAALAYQQQNAPQSSMRFDVVAVEGDNSDKDMNIDWIKSAFDGF
ncbi:MAG: YraN family protein [Cocleimonas sp.]